MAVEEKARKRTELRLEQFLELRRPADVTVSRDGQVAFSVSASYAHRGKRPESHIWIAGLDGACEQATGGGGTDVAPRWSPDGTLAFASDRDHPGRMSVYVLRPGPGEARPIGDVPGSVEDIQWAPDGKTVLVLAADLGADRAGIQAATKIGEQGADEEDPKVTRPFEAWRRLYRIDAESGATEEVTPEGVNVFEYDWDGERVVAVCSDDPSESAWYKAYLVLLDVDRRTADRLYEPEWQIQGPCIAGRGDTVCFVEGFCSDRGVLAGDVTALDLSARTVRHIPVDCDVSSLSRRDDERFWFAGWRGMTSACGSLSLDGAVDEIWSGEATIGLRFQPNVAATEDGRTLVTVVDAPEGPPEVATLDVGSEDGWRRLSDLNRDIPDPRGIGEWEKRTWSAADGLEIEGLLLTPEGDAPFPLLVFVHGGPTGTWSHGFLPAGSLAVLLAQEGYAVFLPNPRGSAGRGQEFARANLGDMGGGDLQDILAGVDALVEEGLADGSRVGVFGGSYGGFMASWAVTQTDRFAASLPFAAVTDWRSFHLTTNIGRFDELFLDADPFEEGGEYDARSPVVQARKCKTPTLMVHGEEDLCVPVGQAKEMYQALVEAGCETELVLYPREGHGLLERGHLLDFWERMRAWFARYLG